MENHHNDVQLKEAVINFSQQEETFRPEKDDDDASAATKLARNVIMAIVIAFSVLLFPLGIAMSIKIVGQYERAVVFRMGKLISKAKGPGMFFIIPFLDKIEIVDMRTIALNIPRQEILTRDSVTVEVDAVLFSRVFNPVWSVVRIEDSRTSTIMLAATTLRNIASTTTLSDFLTNRTHIVREMQTILDEVTDNWGLRIERVEITDVRLPQQMQRAMAAEAEADREAKAKVISAEGEHRASEALSKAAQIISKNPAALQLRYLQTLNTISAENNSTIVFPFPFEFVQAFLGK